MSPCPLCSLVNVMKTLHEKAAEDGHPPEVSLDATLRGSVMAAFKFGEAFNSQPAEQVGALCDGCVNQWKAAEAAAKAFLAEEQP